MLLDDGPCNLGDRIREARDDAVSLLELFVDSVSELQASHDVFVETDSDSVIHHVLEGREKLLGLRVRSISKQDSLDGLHILKSGFAI